MGATSVEDFLQHWGVKGMKWGVRSPAKDAKQIVKGSTRADKKWQKNIYSLRGAVDVHNNLANRINNNVLPSLNAKAKYKDKNLINWSTGQPIGDLGKQYVAEFEREAVKHTAWAVQDVHGTSPSGNYKAMLDTSDMANPAVRVVAIKAAHEATKSTDEPIVQMEVDMHPKTGHVMQAAEIKKNDAAQSDPAGDFLSHWGVKGMKWGIRNDRRKSSDSGASKKGTNNRPHAHELSDEDLKKHVARMELEKRYTDLAGGKHSKSKGEGAAFAKELGKNAVRTAASAASAYAVQKALKKVSKS